MPVPTAFPITACPLPGFGYQRETFDIRDERSPEEIKDPIQAFLAQGPWKPQQRGRMLREKCDICSSRPPHSRPGPGPISCPPCRPGSLLLPHQFPSAPHKVLFCSLSPSAAEGARLPPEVSLLLPCCLLTPPQALCLMVTWFWVSELTGQRRALVSIHTCPGGALGHCHMRGQCS